MELEWKFWVNLYFMVAAHERWRWDGHRIRTWAFCDISSSWHSIDLDDETRHYCIDVTSITASRAATDVIIGTMYNGNRLNRRIITSSSTGREISMGAKNVEQILCLKFFFRVFTNRQEPIYVSFNCTFELSVTTIFISTCCKNFISKIFESFVEINQNQQECLH